MTVQLPEISPAAWEHPADRAALAALGRIPGLDLVLRKIVGSFGEANIRMMYQAGALEVGPNQYPQIYDSLVRVCSVLDSHVPQLFISQSPIVNAGAVGIDEPFIVLESSLMEVLSDGGVEAVLGHEVAHILSEHALYRTMLNLLLGLSASRSPLIGAAMTPIILALLEWNRKAELSCDRAGLLAVQDFDTSMLTLASMAGGIRGREDEINIESFVQQSDNYMDAEGMGAFYKVSAQMGRTHPFPMARAAELRKWVGGGTYHDIIAGNYTRRGNEDEIRKDISKASAYYSESATDMFENAEDYVRKTVTGFADKVQGAFDGWREGGEDPDGDPGRNAPRDGSPVPDGGSDGTESGASGSGDDGASWNNDEGNFPTDENGDPRIDWGDWPPPLT